MITILDFVLGVFTGSITWDDILYSVQDLVSDGRPNEDNILPYVWNCSTMGNRSCS